MRTECYYYDKLKKSFARITCSYLLKLEKENNQRYMELKSDCLYSIPVLDDRYKLTFYRNVETPYFQIRPLNNGNPSTGERGTNESLTHYINKSAIARLKVLNLTINGEAVKVYVSEGKAEAGVICFGKRYEVDIRFKVERTDPENFKEKFGNYLNFEVYHTHPVDWKKAKDFKLQKETLFEYKIASNVKEYLIVDEAKLEQEIDNKAKYYSNKKIYGVFICDKSDSNFLRWKKNEKNNLVSFSSNTQTRFTIFEKDGKIKLAYSGPTTQNKTIYLDKVDKNPFQNIKAAKLVAEYVAFQIYNNQKIFP